jgi:hypothetical protein
VDMQILCRKGENEGRCLPQMTVSQIFAVRLRPPVVCL